MIEESSITGFEIFPRILLIKTVSFMEYRECVHMHKKYACPFYCL